MVWRQTTMFMWLPRRGAMMVAGSTAANPLELTDEETETFDIAVAQATHPIVISDDEEYTQPVDEDEDDGNIIHPNIACHWPPRTHYLSHNRSVASVHFERIDLGYCNCIRVCSAHTCDNVDSAIYCDDTNCRAGSTCGNGLNNWESLVLVRCIKGLGVVTTTDIPRNTVLGEYCGMVTPSNALTDEQTELGFVLAFTSMTVEGDPAYIDAKVGGTLCRFVNHSCAPNSAFEERALGETRKMVVCSRKAIRAGDEITGKYNDNIPFFCLCGESVCISRR